MSPMTVYLICCVSLMLGVAFSVFREFDDTGPQRFFAICGVFMAPGAAPIIVMLLIGAALYWLLDKIAGVTK